MTKATFENIREAKSFCDRYWSKFTMSDPSVSDDIFGEAYITFSSYNVGELIDAVDSSSGILRF